MANGLPLLHPARMKAVSALPIVRHGKQGVMRQYSKVVWARQYRARLNLQRGQRCARGAHRPYERLNLYVRQTHRSAWISL